MTQQPQIGVFTAPLQASAPAPAAAPTQAPVQAPSATAALLPATAVRRAGGYEVTIQGVTAGKVPNKSQAVGLLCRQAIERKQAMIATFIEGSGKSYLSISARGEVARSTAPAPGTTLPSLEVPDPTRDMGTSRQAEDSTRNWVEETLLVGQAAPAKRRGLFGILRGRR